MDKELRELLIERAKELGYKSTRSRIKVNSNKLGKKANLNQSIVHRMLDGREPNPKINNFLKLWAALEFPPLTNLIKIHKLATHQ